ncbi:MFS transporter [Dactylosporangium sp. NPDC051484]|uniref:MFS transporter n=1 Tax=Dactylosporangium sp. NPDC051484 TaxID=3154942 RepID=UPI00344FB330
MPLTPLGALVDVRPLREHPPFRRLWLGSTASGVGGQFGAFAVTYYVWDRTRSPAMVGLVGLAVAAPIVVVALAGSAFIDQADRRRLALLTTAGQLVTGLLMVLVAALPGNGVWAMLGLTATASALSALGTPVLRSLIPGLLPPARLAAGLALNHLSFQLAMLVGPALAGVVTAAFGTAWCLAIDAVTFVAALAGIAALPRTAPVAAAGPRGLAAIVDGLRFTARSPVVRGALIADLCATFLAMPFALFPLLNAERFGGSPRVLGLFASAVAVGGVLASALSGLATRRGRPGLVLLGCGAAWGAALGVAGLSTRLPLTLAALAVAGAADTWAVISRGTAVQATTPESHRGRVAALEHIAGTAGPHLGNLRAGLVAATTSGGFAMVTGAAASLLGVGLVALLSPRLRDLRV